MAKEMKELRDQQSLTCSSEKQEEKSEKSEMFVDLSTRIVELQTETLYCFENIKELQAEMKELRK